MSDRLPMSASEPSFSHYWGWVARQPNSEDLFKMLTTTPGLPDLSGAVADVEKAAKQMLRARVECLKDLLAGYDSLDNSMNREIAVALFNEFMAGCRTLGDFETRNFTKKNKPGKREKFPSQLTGNPMHMNARVEDLNAWGLLPTTPFVFSNQCEEFFTTFATNMYYDQLFGDSQIFYDILKENSHNPNHPPGVHPLPYHPGMYIQNYYDQFPSYSTFRPSPFPHYQQQPQMQPVEYVAQQQQQVQVPMFYPVMQPNFYPMGMTGGVPMQQMQPMQPMQPMDAMYAGQNFQQVPQYQYYGPPPQQNGGYRKYQNNRKKNGRNEQQPQQNHYQENGNGQVYENVNTASSSSSSTAHKTQSVVSEEGPAQKEQKKEAFPVLNGEGPSTSTASAQEAPIAQVAADVVTTPAVVEVPAPVAKKPKAAAQATPAAPVAAEPKAPVASTSTATTPAVAPVVEAPAVNVNTATPVSTDAAASTVLPESRRFSDVVAKTVSPSKPSSVSTASSSRTSEDVPAVAPAEPVNGNHVAAPVKPAEKSAATVPATTALVVDTAEQNTPVVPPLSHRTVAEVVQQNLSATPSPAHVNKSAQPSPAPIAAVAPANGNAKTKSKGSSQQRKQPSVSYAQMLYNSPRPGPPSTSSRSSGSSATAPSKQASTSAQKNGGTEEWLTVKAKKAAEPVLVSPAISEKPVKAVNATKAKPAPAQVTESSDEEGLKSDDPDLEKKRERRRQKRQKIKEVNKQQKQNEKEIARQESLARVNAMNADAPPQQPQPPAFDRNNLAARRRKRQELQKKTEQGESAAPPPPVVESPIPIIPIRQMNGNSSNASIAAGHTAMSAFSGITTGQFRRSSPFAIIAPNGQTSLPLFLPPQAEGGESEGISIRDMPDKFPMVPIARLARQVDGEKYPVSTRTEIDENATMIERILMFDSLEKLLCLDIPESERGSLAKGLDDIKKMYTRVEKAGKLISYKTGSSKVSQKTEEKLLSLTIKLLSNRVELTSVDDQVIEDICGKIENVSTSFNYTNYLSALLEFSQNRANELPDGTALRKNYEQTVVLTKVFLKRTKTVFDKIERFFNFSDIEQ